MTGLFLNEHASTVAATAFSSFCLHRQGHSLVDGEDGNEGGREVDAVCDHAGHQGCPDAHPHHLEYLRRVLLSNTRV